MLKKLLSVLLAAAVMFSFAACTNNDAPEKTTTEAATQAAEEFKPFYIAKENAERIEKSAFVLNYDGEDYSTVEYNGATYLAKKLASGNLHAVYKFGFDFTILDEATKRAGGNYIYFTKNTADGIGGLYAYFLPTGVEMKIVDGPCSEFVMFDMPETFEMYPYGFIVNASTVNVVDLREGDLSSYSKDINDVNIYFETPEYFFSGDTVSTSISTKGKTHLLIKMTEKNKKGEVENELSFTFNPVLGVFVKS